MATVQSTHADREHQVERLLVAQQAEVLDGDLAYAHPTRGNLVGPDGAGLRNGCRRPIDSQDVAAVEARSHSASSCPRPAADLQDSQVRPQRECIHDR